MSAQIPRPYTAAVVAFALLIPLWIVVAGDKKPAGTAPPADKKVQLVNEFPFDVRGTLEWSGGEPVLFTVPANGTHTVAVPTRVTSLKVAAAPLLPGHLPVVRFPTETWSPGPSSTVRFRFPKGKAPEVAVTTP